jgi:hypothetical protein
MSVTKDQIKVLIEIIKLKKKSSTWTPTPEYYINQQFTDFGINDDKLRRFLTSLLIISLASRAPALGGSLFISGRGAP